MKGSKKDKTDKNKSGVCQGAWGWMSQPCGQLGDHVSGPGSYAGKGPEAAKSLIQSSNAKKARGAGAR